jgi:alpha-L-arabinofuranosidase
LEVGIDTVKCFLEGKLLMVYTEPDKLFAISGKDSATGDLIMKIVNAYNTATPVTVQLQHENVSSAKMTSLSSPNLADENSFETPGKFVPVTTILTGIAGNNFTLQVKPYSINVIRLKTGK